MTCPCEHRNLYDETTPLIRNNALLRAVAKAAFLDGVCMAFCVKATMQWNDRKERPGNAHVGTRLEKKLWL